MAAHLQDSVLVPDVVDLAILERGIIAVHQIIEGLERGYARAFAVPSADDAERDQRVASHRVPVRGENRLGSIEEITQSAGLHPVIGLTGFVREGIERDRRAALLVQPPQAVGAGAVFTVVRVPVLRVVVVSVVDVPFAGFGIPNLVDPIHVHRVLLGSVRRCRTASAAVCRFHAVIQREAEPCGLKRRFLWVGPADGEVQRAAQRLAGKPVRPGIVCLVREGFAGHDAALVMQAHVERSGFGRD